MTDEKHILDVAWGTEANHLPRFLGPFDSVGEAEEFAILNAAPGTWAVHPLGFPYMRAEKCHTCGEADHSTAEHQSPLDAIPDDFPG
jgi:hypothetical protein